MTLARIERWLWYAFLATAAWQTRVILWQGTPSFWEWQSASLWFSDVLMLTLFAFALARRPRMAPDMADWLLVPVLAAGALSLGNADSLTVGLYRLARLVQYSALFIYIRHYALPRFNLRESLWAFAGGAAFQAVLGIAQYYHQADIGLRFAGETLLRTGMRGVAVFYDLAQVKILRAYGTLPHPNVLAGYLMLASWAVAALWAGKSKIQNPKSKVFVAALGAVLMWGMFLTYSRTVIAVWLVASVAMTWFRRDFVRPLVFACAVGVLFGAIHHEPVWARMTIAVSDEAVQQRVRYATDALATGSGWLQSINWTGVGIGNFTVWLGRWDSSLPRFMQQPAHSSYLLAYAEIGLLGLAAFAAWLAAVCRRVWHRPHRAVLLCAFGALLAVAAMDHFFWTLQQGMILWTLSLAVIAGGERDAG